MSFFPFLFLIQKNVKKKKQPGEAWGDPYSTFLFYFPILPPYSTSLFYLPILPPYSTSLAPRPPDPPKGPCKKIRVFPFLILNAKIPKKQNLPGEPWGEPYSASLFDLPILPPYFTYL